MTNSRQSWLFYALGGGLGHVTRCTALARAALRATPGLELEVIVNSRFAELLGVEQELGPRARLHRIPAAASTEETARAVRDLFSDSTHDAVVVDCFPRGLAGELAELLPSIASPRVLIHRDLNPRYAARFQLAEFADANYDLILSPGERGPLADLPRARRVAPILIRDHDELLSRRAARQRLGLSGAAPVVAVIAGGKREESAALCAFAHRIARELGDRADVFLASPEAAGISGDARVIRHWPLLEWAAAFDVFVGAGGYNTVWETRAAGRPLVAFAQPRMYDRQSLRLGEHERVSDETEMINRTVGLLDVGGRSAPIPSYANGANEAVALIQRAIRNAATFCQPA